MFIPLRSRHWGALLFCGAFIACSGDGPTAGEATVSTVLISGAPATPVLVGATVQLAATPLNETGGTLSNQRVSWSTTDASIAFVSASGLVTGVGPGRVTISASAGGKAGSVLLDVRAGGPVGNAGATLSMLGGTVVLVIPPGSLTQTTTLLLAPPLTAPQDSRLVPGTVFEIVPEALTFWGGATLAIGYDPARLLAGVRATSLQLYTLINGSWRQVQGSTVDTVAKRVTGLIGRTGVYAIVGTPVDRVTLSSGLLSGALFVSQTGQLTATTYDALNGLLAGRDVQWESSDPLVATVDGAGRVTGIRVGPVTITATSEGRSASTTLAILARPNADWSQATAGLAAAGVLTLDWRARGRESGHLLAGFVAAFVWVVVNALAGGPAPVAQRWRVAGWVVAAALLGALGARGLRVPLERELAGSQAPGQPVGALRVACRAGSRVAAFIVAILASLVAAPNLLWSAIALTGLLAGRVPNNEWPTVAIPLLGAATALVLCLLALCAADVPRQWRASVPETTAGDDRSR